MIGCDGFQVRDVLGFATCRLANIVALQVSSIDARRPRDGSTNNSSASLSLCPRPPKTNAVVFCATTWNWATLVSQPPRPCASCVAMMLIDDAPRAAPSSENAERHASLNDHPNSRPFHQRLPLPHRRHTSRDRHESQKRHHDPEQAHRDRTQPRNYAPPSN